MSSAAPSYRPHPISGFPEWLPQQRIVEQRLMDEIRATFERYGYVSLATPAVEELDVLLAKGETDKEIYTIQRLHGDSQGEARLGLRYDLTVPFARYVALHQNALVFPFKRYQIQPVWRGERPQEGRFREFYQCDIDVVDQNEVSLYLDAELLGIVHAVLDRMPLGGFRLRINNRKILHGFLAGLGLAATADAIRVLDKLDKIGPEKVAASLTGELGLSADAAGQCLRLVRIATPGDAFAEQVAALGVSHPVLDEGVAELRFVMNALRAYPHRSAVADLSIARGFDYYTGTIFEGVLTAYPAFGSICAGGRYENLVGTFSNKRLPGVGASIGLTRILSKLFQEGLVPLDTASLTDMLVVFPSEAMFETAVATAERLRLRGFNAELYPHPAKLGTQLKYANRKQVPFVWFPPFEPGGPHEVKDMKAGIQQAADPETWTRP
jgi:histidyl-tRNA synthetase